MAIPPSGNNHSQVAGSGNTCRPGVAGSGNTRHFPGHTVPPRTQVPDTRSPLSNVGPSGNERNQYTPAEVSRPLDQKPSAFLQNTLESAAQAKLREDTRSSFEGKTPMDTVQPSTDQEYSIRLDEKQTIADKEREYARNFLQQSLSLVVEAAARKTGLSEEEVKQLLLQLLKSSQKRTWTPLR